mmetsp:Transcript_122822/g.216424  ORF Transcript_122822/g.216424 Transcript_122822/m.216424 type:complete len:123 (-) Transcript_122822:1194-1562(-)
MASVSFNRLPRLDGGVHQGAPCIDAVYHHGWHGQEQSASEIIIWVLKPHRNHLETMHRILVGAVTSYMRLDERVLDPEVTDPEHKVMYTVNLPDERLFTANNSASTRLWSRKPLEDDPYENG